MPETTSGPRSLLSAPWVYDLVQALMGSRRARRLIAEQYIRARPGERVLDIGCGTAEILDYLPPGVHYTGYDVSEAYLEAARQRHPGQTFKLGELPQGESADIVLALGVLHHLDDYQCKALFAAARSAGGRLVTVDPCRFGNPLAALLYTLDRGRGIRDPYGYATLAGTVGTLDTHLLPWWLPYAHYIIQKEEKP